MKPSQNKGQLTSWKDDRGFGFIQPEGGGKEVFLHISALKGASRRPRVGDTIFYQLVTESNGKVRAASASIQGDVIRTAPQASHRTLSRASSRKSTRSVNDYSLQVSLLIGALAITAMVTSPFFSNSVVPDIKSTVPRPGCTIKGNISMNTGNRLYHVPGMEDYETTNIRPTEGERWFCTESEAEAAGWRRAPR